MAERILSVLMVLGPLWALLLLFVILYGMNTLGFIQLQKSSEGKVLVTDDGPDLGDAMPNWLSLSVASSVPESDLVIQPYVMLFLTSDCYSCLSLLSKVTNLQEYHVPIKFILVTDDKSVVSKKIDSKFDYIIEDKEYEVANFLKIEKFAFGIFVDESHSVRMKGVISTKSHLEGLIRRRGHYLGNLQWQSLPDAPG